MAFNFGNTSGPAPSFSFGGAPAPGPSPGPAAAPSFSGFGAASSTTGAAPSFGNASTGSTTPAAPSFSFGTAGSDKDSSSSTPAPAPSAFSFGNAAAPATDSAGSAASGGFSFGGGNSTPAVAPESTTDSSKRQAFGFGGPSAANPMGSSTESAKESKGGFGFSGFGAPAPSGDSSGGDSKQSATPSFGLGTPVPASSDGDKESAAAPAPTGFSFGGNTGSTGGSTGASGRSVPLTGGLNFGGTTPAKDGTSTLAVSTFGTPGAPAPVDTPKNSFSAPASGDNHGSNTALVASAPATVATSQKEPPSIEYQTLTVEHILNKFQKQLEEDSLVFVEEAKRVCEYDAILRDSRRDLGNLTHEAQRLVAEQDRTEDQLQGIGVIQNQIEKTLTQVEDQIDLIFQKQSHLTAQDADREREAAYDTAKNVDDCLDNIMASLSTTFDQLSMANSQAFDTQTAEIMKILNKHEDSLNDLEAFAQKLDVDCNEVTQMLQGLRH